MADPPRCEKGFVYQASFGWSERSLTGSPGVGFFEISNSLLTNRAWFTDLDTDRLLCDEKQSGALRGRFVRDGIAIVYRKAPAQRYVLGRLNDGCRVFIGDAESIPLEFVESPIVLNAPLDVSPGNPPGGLPVLRLVESGMVRKDALANDEFIERLLAHATEDSDEFRTEISLSDNAIEMLQSIFAVVQSTIDIFEVPGSNIEIRLHKKRLARLPAPAVQTVRGYAPIEHSVRNALLGRSDTRPKVSQVVPVAELLWTAPDLQQHQRLAVAQKQVRADPRRNLLDGLTDVDLALFAKVTSPDLLYGWSQVFARASLENLARAWVVSGVSMFLGCLLLREEASDPSWSVRLDPPKAIDQSELEQVLRVASCGSNFAASFAALINAPAMRDRRVRAATLAAFSSRPAALFDGILPRTRPNDELLFTIIRETWPSWADHRHLSEFERKAIERLGGAGSVRSVWRLLRGRFPLVVSK